MRKFRAASRVKHVVTTRRYGVVMASASVFLLVLGAVVRNQFKVYSGRHATAAAQRQPSDALQRRYVLFELLRPVALTNCRLERFGEPHDGGYLMCTDLLKEVEAGYSYGISGYDQWGCDISSRFGVLLHQYDCYDTRQPACPAGKTTFHAECVGGSGEVADGRLFNTIRNHLTKNADRSKHIVLKMDVEGAEWDSLLSAPDPLLLQIDQMAVEFHWLRDKRSRWILTETYLDVVRRLKQFFHIVHVHFNNFSCTEGLEPFPSWAYEVLFVNKRLAVVDASRGAGGLHPLDAPNAPSIADCQPSSR